MADPGGGGPAPRHPRRYGPQRPSPATTPAPGQPAYFTEPIAPLASDAPARPSGRSGEESFTIPTGYGDHRIVLMVKDPWWLYAYWEIQPQQERDLRRQLAPDETAGLRSVLRVYDVTPPRSASPHEAGGANSSFDIPLSGLASNWFIHVNAPHRSFIVDIGLLTRGGRFMTLARSNRVTTPRAGPSDVIDEAWMTTDEDYWRLFGMTAGVGMGASESAVKALLQRALSSPGWLASSRQSRASVGLKTQDTRRK